MCSKHMSEFVCQQLDELEALFKKKHEQYSSGADELANFRRGALLNGRSDDAEGMNLIFTIPGEPTAQGRPRFSTHGGFVKAYDPEKSRNYKAYVKLLVSEAMQNIGLTLTELPLGVEIIADVGIPASKSKKFKEQALNGLQLPIKKPDVDNVAKIILDSISGIVYKDDKQIVKLTVSKKYSDTPKVEVKIYNVE